jgi:hypothetical protein
MEKLDSSRVLIQDHDIEIEVLDDDSYIDASFDYEPEAKEVSPSSVTKIMRKEQNLGFAGLVEMPLNAP